VVAWDSLLHAHCPFCYSVYTTHDFFVFSNVVLCYLEFMQLVIFLVFNPFLTSPFLEVESYCDNSTILFSSLHYFSCQMLDRELKKPREISSCYNIFTVQLWVENKKQKNKTKKKNKRWGRMTTRLFGTSVGKMDRWEGGKGEGKNGIIASIIIIVTCYWFRALFAIRCDASAGRIIWRFQFQVWYFDWRLYFWFEQTKEEEEGLKWLRVFTSDG